VRGEYGYTDEYILDKTLLWLSNAVHYIARRKHNDRVAISVMIANLMGNYYVGDANHIYEPPTYDELIGKKSTKLYGNHDETFDSGSLDFVNKLPTKL